MNKMFGQKIILFNQFIMKIKIFFFWLILVIGWNYKVPNATPFMDLDMAVIFSLISYLTTPIFNE